MSPETVHKATKTLAQTATSWSNVRLHGAALGRALAAQVKARAITIELINQAAATQIELALLQLAAIADEILGKHAFRLGRLRTRCDARCVGSGIVDRVSASPNGADDAR